MNQHDPSLTTNVEPSLESVRQSLQAFFERNEHSEVVYDDKEKRFILKKPWGDDSIEFVINDDDDKIVAALNGIYLPGRYSAIYHNEAQRLEVLYFVFTDTQKLDEFLNRKFDFFFRGEKIPCGFDLSSAELLHIAKHARPVGNFGRTGYRNLMAYLTYAIVNEDEAGSEIPEEQAAPYKDGTPISFWIDVGPWNDDNVLALIEHLNFYMSYYDRESPMVLIHAPTADSPQETPQKRFPIDVFPSTINGREIDRHLLHLWQASTQGDPARRFLYSYQIIEYSAFYLLEDEISKSIIRLLSAPEVMSRPQEVALQLIEAVSESKLSDPQKIEQVLRKAVRPDTVWGQIEQNRTAFSAATRFEGGHEIKPLIKDTWQAADFATAWPDSFARTIRTIRNALSHGREQRMTSVIAPTVANMRLLRNWVPVISAAACDVMVYRNVS